MDVTGDDESTVEAKQTLRRAMRELRKALPDRAERSQRIAEQLAVHPAVVAAHRVMVYSTMGSEVDTAPFVAWCVAHDKSIATPEDGVDPAWPEVVLVPGLAFTSNGDRCGQGGGWYDRFLALISSECATIGIGFAEQLIDALPIGPFDLCLDHVVVS